MNRWWRFDNDAHNNPKLLRLSDEMFRAWTVLLSLASKNAGVLPPADDIALTLRLKPAKVSGWIAKLVKAELLDEEDGVFSPHNWKSRQYVSDDSTERVRKHRDKKRNAQGNGECNVSSDVTGNVTVTPPKQSRAETDSEQSRADACAPIDEELKRKASALGAAISANFIARHLPIPDLKRCEVWLTMGYAHGTVLAAVEAVLKRGTKPSTLDYFDGAICDMHAKAPQTAEPVEVTHKLFIEVGTSEWAAWDQYRRRTENRGWPMTQHQVGRVLKDGWWFLTQWPPGYDETNQTGEERVA